MARPARQDTGIAGGYARAGPAIARGLLPRA